MTGMRKREAPGVPSRRRLRSVSFPVPILLSRRVSSPGLLRGTAGRLVTIAVPAVRVPAEPAPERRVRAGRAPADPVPAVRVPELPVRPAAFPLPCRSPVRKVSRAAENAARAVAQWTFPRMEARISLAARILACRAWMTMKARSVRAAVHASPRSSRPHQAPPSR